MARYTHIDKYADRIATRSRVSPLMKTMSPGEVIEHFDPGTAQRHYLTSRNGRDYTREKSYMVFDRETQTVRLMDVATGKPARELQAND